MKQILIFMKPNYIFKMAAPIPPMLKYSIVYNLLNFPPILIKFVSKFIVCIVIYFKVQYLLRLRSPLSKYIRKYVHLLSLLQRLHLSVDFNITSHKFWV